MADHDPEPPAPAAPREAGFLQVVRAVFWGFFGVRKRRGFEQDVTRIKPLHIVIAGLIGGLLFVLTLVMIVRTIVNHA